MTALYTDIAERTQGDIYIGVVGPVRTGKSTFIKRFMELFVLDKVTNEHERRRVTDELPQSGAGKTIMTTQPKFVPNEAVKIVMGDAHMRVRMVDCVGYMVEGALGFEEDGKARMVRTPWSENEMPFSVAAELGTRKVITDHATIGVVMTTDGTIADLPHSAYAPVEERVVREMREQGKPFVVMLNSRSPRSASCADLRDELAAKYDVPVLAVNALEMTADDALELMEAVLLEFPIRLLRFETPKWMQALGDDHPIMQELLGAMRKKMGSLSRVRDYTKLLDMFDDSTYFTGAQVGDIDLGVGEILMKTIAPENLFFTVLSERTGVPIADEGELMRMVGELAEAKLEYDKVKGALRAVRETGYGIISPSLEDLTLAEPEMIKRSGGYGVRLSASGPSLHLIRADVNCEVSPTVGSEAQSEQLLDYLMQEFENNPAAIWDTDIFGKSLHDLVSEGMSGKLTRIPDELRGKLQRTLSRIVNEGSGNMICILL